MLTPTRPVDALEMGSRLADTFGGDPRFSTIGEITAATWTDSSGPVLRIVANHITGRLQVAVRTDATLTLQQVIWVDTRHVDRDAIYAMLVVLAVEAFS